MGLFSKRPSAIPTDMAQWPGMENNMQHLLSDAAPEHITSCMPAEWYPQRAVQLTWPHAATDWKPLLREVTECYIRLAYEISAVEDLIIVCPDRRSVDAILAERMPKANIARISIVECPTNDTWARDHGFITILNDGKYELLDFCFNGWGGKFEAGLDNAVNKHLFDSGLLRGTYRDNLDFVLEGGSIESDGQGTLLTTSQCLLNPNRNPRLGRADIEQQLLTRLKSRRILWLDHGYLAGDDTDSHIDTLARLCPNDTILYVKCSDPSDEHYEQLSLMEEQLRTFLTMSGKPYRLLALPMAPVMRDADGLRLPATYANYLVMNGRVLMPSYGNDETDAQAARIIEQAFPNRSVRVVDCRVLVLQHGSLHCSTMQYF